MANTNSYSTSEYMRIAEVASLFRVTIPTVRTWDRAGKISAVRTPGNQRVFLRTDIEALLTENKRVAS